MADSYSSSSYYYSSTTNTTDGSTTTGHRYTTSSHTDANGNTIVRTAHQDLGQPAVIEERRYDRTGQEQQLLESGTSSLAGGVRRIAELDDETSATTYDAGTAYGGAASSNQDQGGEAGDEARRSSYDIGPSLYRARTYNPYTGAYEEQRVNYDSDGVPRYRKDGGRSEHRSQSGYTTEERMSREFETDQGTRLKRETDVNMSDVL
ncbi:uncharacterized protein ACLA_093060 [Aspergillus clavatus NRRL 1]|uniref:Uncharacterized protein n=1 Tax=Aspergillus clavatus (strain ATCC 1007 / CBS 513.65 / DSM 816 / NCTC 3887 / NRRL 1 / QM 1276 / 107) TaxID=344612 RepID=A1CFF8_ASPCL|nr:uncharacterized protein ACLA_093060 [Aspergillus clavatus NRRL 1]EAW11607.1 conserved hypothetical protein [Aspergillus clavatus NRRL 1]